MTLSSRWSGIITWVNQLGHPSITWGFDRWSSYFRLRFTHRLPSASFTRVFSVNLLVILRISRMLRLYGTLARGAHWPTTRLRTIVIRDLVVPHRSAIREVREEGCWSGISEYVFWHESSWTLLFQVTDLINFQCFTTKSFKFWWSRVTTKFAR